MGIFPFVVCRRNGRHVWSSAGDAYVDFASADYLGVCSDNMITQVDRSPYCSPLFMSTSQEVDVINRVCSRLRFEDAVICASGTQANYAITETLASTRTRVLLDRACHVSFLVSARNHCIGSNVRKAVIIKGVETCRAELRTWLAGGGRSGSAVVISGVGSMSGVRADVRRASEFASEACAALIIDDAHGAGVLGDDGFLNRWDAEIAGRRLVYTFSMSKSMGAPAAVVAGSREFIQQLRSMASAIGFSGACHAAAVQLAHSAMYNVCDNWSERRVLLWRNVRKLADMLRCLKYRSIGGEAGIIMIEMRSESEWIETISRLMAQRVLALPVAFPAVKRGEWWLRLSVSALHSDADLERVEAALRA